MENQTGPDVYSYHTFYFPFVWDDAGSLSMDDFVDKLTKDGKWRDISVATFEDAGDDKVVNYQSLQFFTPAARKSLFGWDENFVKCFEYSGIKNKAEYYICNSLYSKKEKKEYIEEEYKLNLDGIKLKVYNTGIAILTFETENRAYRTMKDVKNINEYGRRIFAPFFIYGRCPDCDKTDERCPYCATINKRCPDCATELGIIFKDGKNLSSASQFEPSPALHGLSDGKILSSISRFEPKKESQCIPGFITYLLPEVKIAPAIDDRMFVACLVNDAEELKKILDYTIDDKTSSVENVHLNYETNEKASKSLYEFLYIDKEGCCSCPTQSMRNKLLSQSIYDRWAENTVEGKIAGTMHGVTHHSFMCLTSATLEYIAERPFLTIYTHMISAVLAQRASILAFDNKISKSSRGFENGKRIIGIKHIKELKKLQDSYIAFLNQHMNIEITCQEQGIELYEMLQNEMYVSEDHESLSKELSLLNEAADVANEIRNNKFSIIITILFGLISAQPLINLFSWLYKVVDSLFNAL